MKTQNNFTTKKLVLAAILTALVVLLQVLGSFIKFGPFSISLVLIPIVVGAATCGSEIGAWLGLVFGVVVLTKDSAPFLAVNFWGTVATVLLKGVACGYLAAITYHLFSKKSVVLGTAISAVVCPVVNTGVFLIGCKLFFMDTLAQWALAAGFENAESYIIFGMVGINFLIEIGINLILSPAIVRILKVSRSA